MPHLWNPTKLPMFGQYGGIQYAFPPKTRVTIKNRREREEIHVAEDIAAKIYADLSPLGLILVDDENPIPMEEGERISRENLKAFISGLISDFNDLNAAQASENLKIFQVPKHYREMKKILDELKTEDDEDSDGFIGKEKLEEIRERGEINRDQALRAMLAAAESGDPEALMAAAKAAQKKIEGGSRTAETAAPSDEFVTRSAPGRGGAQHGRKPTGRRRGRPPAAEAANG